MCVADTAAVTGHWNNITALTLPSNISLTETAELYAKLNVAFYDSNIAAWNIKYNTPFWRPITAIRYVPACDRFDSVALVQWVVEACQRSRLLQMQTDSYIILAKTEA